MFHVLGRRMDKIRKDQLRWSWRWCVLVGSSGLACVRLARQQPPPQSGLLVMLGLFLVAILGFAGLDFRRYRTSDVISSIIVVLGGFLIVWMNIYVNVSHDRRCFGTPLTRTDGLYFATTTLTTTGYGDLKPRSEECRQLVTAEQIQDLFLVGSLVAMGSQLILKLRPPGVT